MPEILTINPSSPDPAVIARAADCLRHGDVVAIPTDTFYGLAANPFDPSAVEKVFFIKQRDEHKPLLLLIDSIEMAEDVARELSPQFYTLAKHFWPGPLTLVVKASPRIPAVVTAHTGTIGLRLPAARIPLALIHAAQCPVTATSANRTGEPELSTAQEVERAMGERLGLVLDGGISHATKPSTVVKLTDEVWEVLREGAISRREIAAALGDF